jgi:hypothetical protein
VGGRVSIGLIWLSVSTIGGLSWTLMWKLHFRKRQEIAYLAAGLLLAPQEGQLPLDLVTVKKWKRSTHFPRALFCGLINLTGCARHLLCKQMRWCRVKRVVGVNAPLSFVFYLMFIVEDRVSNGTWMLHQITLVYVLSLQQLF